MFQNPRRRQTTYCTQGELQVLLQLVRRTLGTDYGACGRWAGGEGAAKQQPPRFSWSTGTCWGLPLPRL